MALNIQLWLDGALVDGLETDWEDVERLLCKSDELTTILDSVDPYDDLTVNGAQLIELVRECEMVIPRAVGETAKTLSKLVTLAEAGLEANRAELRFVGD